MRPRRPLIPDVFVSPAPTDVEIARLNQQDLSQMSPDVAWAEMARIVPVLAQLVACDGSGRAVIDLVGNPIFERDWLATRLHLLQQKMRKAA